MSDIDSNNEEIIDLLVIGGGINGCAIARDAAGRGLSVMLCEKDDLASHTSSASTKLIHGGLRYLENYDFTLVRHSLKEREILLNSAPHIIWPLRFILPHHHGLRPRWLLRLGLFIYDHIGGREKLPVSRGIDLREHPAGDLLKSQYRHAFEYSDCWVQDARLVILNARDASANGAKILTHTRCGSLSRRQQHWEVTLQDEITGRNSTVLSKAIVNASGPWVDKTLALYARNTSNRSIRLVKGSHIIVRKLFDHDYPYIFQNADGRIVFAIPFEQDFTLLGTTDVDYHGDPGEVKIDQQEISYICNAVSEYTEKPVEPRQVIWSYSGVRPLFDDHSGNASKVSRDYELELDQRAAPIISVYGGKITTSRILAQQVMDLLAPLLQIKHPAWTGLSCLPGGDFRLADFDQFLADCKLQYHWLDESIVLDYCRNYGTDIYRILKVCRQHKDLGVYFGAGLYAVEVIFLIENEWALSSDDILWRRTRKGLRLTEEQKSLLDVWLSENYGQNNTRYSG